MKRRPPRDKLLPYTSLFPSELYDFIDWSKTSDKQAIKKSVTDKFSIDNMILEISSEYLV